jgi:hypothetical protein
MYICQLADQIVPQLRNLLDIYDHEIAVEGFQILADCLLHLKPQQKGRKKWLARWLAGHASFLIWWSHDDERHLGIQLLALRLVRWRGLLSRSRLLRERRVAWRLLRY